VSNIEQRQHCESRIFCFSPSGRDRSQWFWLAWVHQGSKTGIGTLDFRFFVAILVDVSK
jgi:hypothetical protein